jgi:hypothetical protein
VLLGHSTKLLANLHRLTQPSAPQQGAHGVRGSEFGGVHLYVPKIRMLNLSNALILSFWANWYEVAAFKTTDCSDVPTVYAGSVCVLNEDLSFKAVKLVC